MNDAKHLSQSRMRLDCLCIVSYTSHVHLQAERLARDATACVALHDSLHIMRNSIQFVRYLGDLLFHLAVETECRRHFVMQSVMTVNAQYD